MTPKEHSIEELQHYKKRLICALQAAHICVFEVDIQRQLYTFFENSEDIFGVSGESILADVQPYSQLSPDDYQKAVSAYFSHPDDYEIINHAFEKIFSGEPTSYHARMKAGNTDFIWCKIDVTPVLENGVPVKMVGIISDINKIKLQMSSLEQQIRLDSFTGLYSKTFTEQKIAELLEKFPNDSHAFFLMDLDDFKKINDALGHHTGDKVIKSVAAQLRQNIRKNDIAGRIGGDEFCVFIRGIDRIDKIKEIAARMLTIHSPEIPCTKSIGISRFPMDGSSFLELYEKADQALYQAKKQKNTYKIFRGDFS